VSAITDEVGATQSDAVAFARQFGLESVELRNVPETKKEFAFLSTAELRGYASELRRNKLKVSMLKTSLLKDDKRSAQRKDDFAAALAAAGTLGTDRMGIFTGARTDNPPAALPGVAKAIAEFVPLAEAAKVRLVIENDASQNVATAAEIRALMNLLPSPFVGFDWDPRNALSLGEAPWPDGYGQLPKTKMLGVQVKGDSLEGGSALDWRAILNGLEKDNYQGPVALATERFQGAYLNEANQMMGDLLHIVSRLD
jgi:sugar phosphate isomerase/epimerase